MEHGFYDQERALERGGQSVSLGRYTAKTFLLMFLGLLVTFGTAVFWYASGLMMRAMMTVPAFHLIVLVAELVVVLAMSAALGRISPATAGVFFFVYALLTGVTFSTYFYLFEMPSLVLVFAATALYFGGMAVFGYLTQIDLSRMRTVLLGGLIFLIAANLLMLFLPGLAAVDHVVCTIGVVIFLGYTAYDTQKIKAYYQAFRGDGEMLRKASILSALQLYLDFVNLFLYLLRIFGRRKN